VALTTKPPTGPSEGERAARISIRFLWWAPVSVVVGFVAASRLLSESWPLWQVAPLALILATPFAIGAYHGLRAVRSGEGRGWIGLVLHLTLMAIALVMPITEAMS
jgi:hypothetical protein